MTATVAYGSWGPASLGLYVGDAGGTTLPAGSYLDSAADTWGFKLIFPKSGNVSKIGFYITTVDGTPPAYNANLVTVGADGLPTTTGYNSSIATAFTPTVTGWLWVTLASPIAVTMGDTAAVQVWAGVTPPDSINRIRCVVGSVIYHENFLGRGAYYDTSWLNSTGMIVGAVSYDDGAVWGFPITAWAEIAFANNSAADEIGCKFTLPVAMTVRGACFALTAVTANAPYDVVLYGAADNVLATASCADEDIWLGGQAGGWVQSVYFSTAVDLSADTIYRLVLKPQSTSTIRLGGLVFESMAARTGNILIPEAANWQKTARADAGAWTESADTLMWMGLLYSALTLGAGAGGAYGFIG